MELLNATKMVAGYAPGMRPDGRELLVVVIKGTFNLPGNGEEPTLADEQLPLVEADTFTGEPGLSAPIYESDYAPYKPFCDVVLNGSAYAPQGKPARSVEVGLKVGSVAKAFRVVGDRAWEAGVGGIGPGFAKPFVRKEISYDVAFGGTDRFSEDESDHDAFMENPIGIGYRKGLTSGPIDGMPVPNTEERKDPVTSPLGTYLPMSFGPVARGWQSRARFAGTYDDDWLENVFPFLPADFDDRYFQCAPQDQQTDHPQGGEEVTLVNLTPDGRREFTIPKIEVPVVFFREYGDEIHATAVPDTLFIEPNEDRLVLVWRTHIPLRQNMFEIGQVVAGRMSRGWWRARKLGKTHHAGLGAAASAVTHSDMDDIA
jgi:hypothetical protein